jgi:hypothetical protein
MFKSQLVLKDLRQIHNGSRNGIEAKLTDGRVLRFDNMGQVRYNLEQSGVLCLGFNLNAPRRYVEA